MVSMLTSVTRTAPSTRYSWLLTETMARRATEYEPPGRLQRHMGILVGGGVAPGVAPGAGVPF